MDAVVVADAELSRLGHQRQDRFSGPCVVAT
jgi:hypothetical protein